MSRTSCYAFGSLAMLALLGVAIFGEPGTMLDRFAARGALAAVFLAMQMRRYQCRSLMQQTVTIAAFVGALLSVGAYKAVSEGIAGATLTDGILLLLASVISAGLMTLSFYFLTLRRGFMA